MMKTVLLASAALLALSGSALAGAAHPAATVSGRIAKHVVHGVQPGTKTLYDQNSNDNGGNATSQNFESAFDAYDDSGADDFTVPTGHKWTITEVDVTGMYRYTGGSADTAEVSFYKDKNGKPGRQVGETCAANTNDGQALGSFRLDVSSCLVKLKAGIYWIGVQTDLDFGSNPAKQWYWETNGTPQGFTSMWQDPNGGWVALGVPANCSSWKPVPHCLRPSTGDFMFALIGKDRT